METKELICVNCPKGCRIKVTLEDGKVVELSGYSCEQGKNYAAQETVRPMRVLTSTVKINNGTMPVIPVITSGEIPLDLMSEAMETLKKITLQAPVKMDDIVIADFLGTGKNLVVSRSMNKA